MAKDLINFEITWTILLFFIPIILFLISKIGLTDKITLSTVFFVIGFLYFINLMSILLNTFRISNDKEVIYLPHIKFLK